MQHTRKLLWTAIAIFALALGLIEAAGSMLGYLIGDNAPAATEKAVVETTVAATAGKEGEENSVYLSDLPWRSATTGWVAVAEDDLPARDAAFRGGPLIMGGNTYAKGIGVYPLSEISYALDSLYSSFEAEVGLNDLPMGVAAENVGGVVFSVYLDGALAYDSGVVQRGQLPLPVQVPLAGVQELRLVVSTAGPPSMYNNANWAGARLLRPAEPVDEDEAASRLAPLREQVADQGRQRQRDHEVLDVLAAEEREAVAAVPASPSPTTVAAVDASRKILLLRNRDIVVRYGLGGEEHGLLTLLHVPSGRLVLYRADAGVLITPGLRLSLHHDTLPAGGESYRFSSIQDPVFGGGKRLEVFLETKDSAASLTMALTVFDGGPYFVEEIRVTRSPAPAANARVSHFEPLGLSNLALGDGLRYLTDISRIRSAAVADDGLQRRETVDQGKPVFLSSEGSGMGLLLAALDEATGPTELMVQVDPGRVMGRLGLVTGPVRAVANRDGALLTGPRLYVEVVTTTRPRQAFQNFRRFATQLYRPLPLPGWVRYQWLSWYVYYMDVNEERIRRQIDYIAANLNDLGPWHILIDAGWYVAEGRPGAEWRNVDRAKFPGGLRAIVDYAHSKNVKVVLYFSAPYLDSRVRHGDWLGLRAIIEQHRDWLIPLGEDETRQSFVYDFDNPALRAYMAEVMRDYFVAYDVDGIKIDGLGNAEGAVLTPEERDAFGLVDKARQPGLNIYRFVHDKATALKDDVYIESGWLTPLFANSLAHTFRYGDEAMAFSNRYPFPGLVEHIDYTIAQQALWGQRANMGAVYADPNEASINQQWLQAALALGVQTALSFDLTAMSDETLSRYRSLLVHYRPFAGTTYHGSTSGVESFATTVDGLTYLGVLNRGEEAREAALPLSDYGLLSGARYSYYDVAEEQFGLTQGNLKVKLGPRSLRLFLLRDGPGVMWTNSSFSIVASSDGDLTLTAGGPAQVGGFMQLFVPGLKAVALDGLALMPGREAGEGRYAYDAATGILTLGYRHERVHRIEIAYLVD